MALVLTSEYKACNLITIFDTAPHHLCCLVQIHWVFFSYLRQVLTRIHSYFRESKVKQIKRWLLTIMFFTLHIVTSCRSSTSPTCINSKISQSFGISLHIIFKFNVDIIEE